MFKGVVDGFRKRVVGSTTRLFAHAPYPLEHTLSYRGDPGLFGPDSVTWPVIGDAAAFIGGIRALLVQAAHPEVVAGVADHSTYRADPLGRLSRTSAYVTATSFGSWPEIEAAVQIVRGAHVPVRGRSHRDRPYAAGTPKFAAWVHNVLTDSFLAAFQEFGPQRLSAEEADQFVSEQTAVGRLLDADPLPATAGGLSGWLSDHPDIGPSPGLAETVTFLRSPPLPPVVRIGYRLMFAAAVATVPPRLRDLLGVRKRPGALLVGRTTIRFLRWALGSSPSWQIALVRVGADVPPGLFRQPLPPKGDQQ
ncbi:MAG: DUF2236 domain-containing protein [Acidimicrobiia bacterium]|nr:DUF2236 domain-containing protein [Acidimicrobiia bacterium]MDH3397744.1 DUF2236 domain-containing protein [Acidimicrobiia bacterium]